MKHGLFVLTLASLIWGLLAFADGGPIPTCNPKTRRCAVSQQTLQDGTEPYPCRSTKGCK